MTQAGPSRRVLAVTCNFPPDASVGTMRTLRLVRHLAEQGWDIGVLTVSPDGLRPGTVVDEALLAKVPAGVAVFHRRPLRPFERLAALLKRSARPAGSSASAASMSGAAAPAPPAPSASARRPSRVGAIRRAITAVLTLPDREISWLLPAVAEGRRQIARHRPDVIYSSGPPFTAHLVALVLARLTGVPWVADFRDPWSRAPWREDRFAFERRAWAICERMVATRAHALVFVTATNRDDFAREYGPALAARFTVVSNGCDVSEFDGLQAESGAPFVMLHAGSLYGARNPAGLFRAVAQAIANGSLDRSTFRLRFMGRVGIPNVDLPALARELGLSDVVEFVSHLPRRQGLQAMVNASALLIVQPVTTVSIPAKLYEYMATGRPILALAEPGGETAALVEQTHAGITVLADDEGAVAAALGRIVALARGGFSPVARQAYDGNARASELRQVLEGVIASGRTP